MNLSSDKSTNNGFIVQFQIKQTCYVLKRSVTIADIADASAIRQCFVVYIYFSIVCLLYHSAKI
jgi:hypothetical protein